MTSTQTPIWASMEAEYEKWLAEWDSMVQDMEEILNRGIDWLTEIGAPWPPSE